MNITTYIDCGALGEEVEIFVTFDYQPHEEAILHPIEDVYPGCDESADITSVVAKLNGHEIEVLPLMPVFEVEELEEECLESLR